MKIIVLQEQEIASYIADQLEKQINHNPQSILGMTTGSTPIKLGIYQEWIHRAKRGTIDFSNAKFVNPDELLGLPANHPETYRSYMKSHLFTELGVRPEQTFIPNSATENADKECLQFERVLNELGGIDWQLMGLGLNGHIAFIEPADSLPSTTYVVELAKENCPYVEVTGGKEIISHAISVGLGTIMKAKAVVLTAVGENKADIVEKAVLGPITTRVPASFLQLHKSATIILDQGAARKIPKCYLDL